MSFHPETENYKYWTIEEDKKLESLTKIGIYSFKDIGKELNRTGVSCQHRARHIGLTNSFIHRKYSQNENFWSIPNFINSYWSGFSAADASINIRGKNQYGTYKLEIQKSDENHIKELVKNCQFNGKISENIRPEKNSHTVSIRINSAQWIKDLKNVFNIEPNKTQRLMPPNLEKKLMFIWLIGYIDGDGCIFYNKCNKKIGLNFVSSSENLIKWIHNFIETEFPKCIRKKENHYFKNKKSNCWHINFSGIKVAIILNYLSQFPVPKLQRKWQNSLVLSKIDEYKQKYPQFFTKTFENLSQVT